jgi:NAD(P)-dependent dehydrogenase (short-subunit alcohol dehydrogenase family)
VEPEVISDAMVFLCGPTGRHITGVALPVDGGQIIS